jgi:hypothetical protein
VGAKYGAHGLDRELHVNRARLLDRLFEVRHHDVERPGLSLTALPGFMLDGSGRIFMTPLSSSRESRTDRWRRSMVRG